LGRWWSSWGLVTRLSVAIGLLVLAVAVLQSALTLKGDAERAHTNHAREAAEILDLLAPVVADLAVLGDYASVKQRLNDIAGTREDIEWLRWTDTRGGVVASSSPERPIKVPAWFAIWADIPPHERTTPIALGGKNYGSVDVRITPGPALASLWDGFTENVAISMFVVSILLAIIPLLLKEHLQALGRLARATERFRMGDTTVRVDPTGAPEAVAVAGSFNRMADQITALLDSLSQSRAELHEQLHFTQELIETIPIPVFFKNREGVYLGVNKAWEQFFGRSRAEFVGQSVHDLYPHDPATAAWHHAMDEKLWQSPGMQSYEIPITTADGKVRHTVYYKATFTHADGSVAGLLGAITDITERKNAETALFAEKERAHVTLESIGDAVITTDAVGAIQYLNPTAQRMTGWTIEEARGKPASAVLRLIDEHTGSALGDLAERCMRENVPVRLESNAELLGQEDRVLAVEVCAAPIRDREGGIIGAVIALRDTTNSRNMARQLSWQATHDALTGLENRRAFEEELRQAIALAKQLSFRHCLLYLDLDQFKVVNDTCGHAAGDELLKQLSFQLQQQVRGSDTLARLGGDEFGVLLHRCPLDKATEIARNLLTTIRSFRFVWHEKQFTIGASIGVVSVDGEMRESDAMSKADLACYAAKEAGRNRLHVYEEHDEELAQRHSEMQWVSRINHALERNHFVLFYQTIAPLRATDEGRHFEVLVRMQDPVGNLIPPGQFMPAAERYNLMPAIDRWIIAAALEWLMTLPELVAGLDTCTINLSGHSLGDPSLAEFIAHELERTAISPTKICFEITETAAIANLGRTRELIGKLKVLGCRFALDDFGAGFSSFAYLKSLPVDYLKIDGGFVRNMVEDATDATMVRAIHDVGHALGIKTIAEFVENDAIVQRLREIGVDYAQGYGIAPPRPFSELMRAAAARTA
jgi:diguanylate cyclase (GGDEF)-like protein/PAS domain S-box-containing protein